MMEEILYYTLPYFFIGALAIVFISHKRKDEKANNLLWLKYIVYFFIVHGVFALVLFKPVFFNIFCWILLSVAAYEVFSNGIKRSRNKLHIAIALLIFLIIAMGFVKFINYPKRDIAVVYLAIIVFDGYSQIIGQLIGRHPLSPLISPNKTIEGTLGGLLFVIFTFLIESKGKLQLISIFFCFWICGFALIGDLLASWYKRSLRIKDYGTLIPGHGGVLDRFDSFITAGSAAFIFLHFIEPKLLS